MDGNTPFFRPGGTMEPHAPSYLARAADDTFFNALMQREYVFLLDSRQKGKSSLVGRTMLRLQEAGVIPIKLDLQRIGANVTPEQWYAGLLSGIGQDLKLDKELFEYWGSRQAVGPLARWLGALDVVVIPQTEAPIVIFIDEVDFVRALPFPTDEFFAGIRDCFNRRAEGSGFERLTFCLVGVTTPGQLIRNPEITPFNIGTKIELSDFTAAETATYGAVLDGSGRNGSNLMSRVHYWVNGHPYLTQLLCSQIAARTEIKSGSDVDRLVKEMFFTPESRHREPNFADVERRLLDPDVPGMSDEERRAQVLDLYGRLLRGRGVAASDENPVVASLRLAGVGKEEKGTLRLRNRTYERVFNEKWRVQSMPGAELRRQRGAARIAVLRTVFVTSILVVAVSAIAVNMWRLSDSRKQALSNLSLRTSQLNKTSSEREQALRELQSGNEELQRTIKGRNQAMQSLRHRSAEVKRRSEERQRALVALELQAQDLARTSREKQRTLEALRASNQQVLRENYIGLMASNRVAMQNNRWQEVAEIIAKTRYSSNRGWEWGHVAMLMNGASVDTMLHVRTEFEWESDGTLSAVTPEAIYKVMPQGLQLRRKFKGRKILPQVRSGNLRSGFDPDTGRSVIRDAVTDQIVVELDKNSLLEHFYPDEKVIIVRRLDWINEKRDFQGNVIESYGKQVVNGIRQGYFPDGRVTSLDYEGRLTISNAQGKQLASTLIFPPPSDKNHSWVTSIDRSYIIHLDGNVPRVMQVRRTSDLSIVSTLEGPPVTGGTGAFSHDNRHVAIARDGAIALYDVETGRQLNVFYGFESTNRVRFLPGDRYMASLDRSGLCRVWRISRPSAVRELVRLADTPVNIDVTSDDRFIFAVTAGQSVLSIDTSSGQASSFERSKMNSATKTGDFVISTDKSGWVARHSMEKLDIVQRVKVFDEPISYVYTLFGGKKALVAVDKVPRHIDAKFAIIDVGSLQIESRFAALWPKEGVNDIAEGALLTSNSEIFALCANEIGTRQGPMNGGTGLVKVFSAATGKVVRLFQFKDDIACAALSEDGSKLVFSFYGDLDKLRGRVEVYDTRSGSLWGRLELPRSLTPMWMYFDDGILVASLPTDRAALWNLKRSRKPVLISPGRTLQNCDVSRDGTRIVTIAGDGTAIVWDTETGRDLLSLTTPAISSISLSKRAASAAVFSNDGRKIFLHGMDGRLRVFESQNWKN